MVNISKIHTAFEEIRFQLRRLSVAADIPIEPLEQTAICDASLQIPGVLVSGVPGGERLIILINSRWI
jgi:phosphomevalonate kinase